MRFAVVAFTLLCCCCVAQSQSMFESWTPDATLVAQPLGSQDALYGASIELGPKVVS